MTYTTTPGTIPHRAVEYMSKQPRGTELSTIELADALRCDECGLVTNLCHTVKAGLLKSQVKIGTRKMTYWSLGDGVALASSTDPDDQDDWPVAKAPEGIPDVAASVFEPKMRMLFTVGELSDGTVVVESMAGAVNLLPEPARVLREFMAAAGCVA